MRRVPVVQRGLEGGCAVSTKPVFLMAPESRQIYQDRLDERHRNRAAAGIVGRWLEGQNRTDIATCDEIGRRLLDLEAELEQARADRIALAAFVMGAHEFDSDSCGPTPGVDCYEWCKACKVLAGLPPEVLEAATAKRTADEIASYQS